MGKAWFGGGKANLCRAGLWQSIGWKRRCIAGRSKGGASKGTATLWRGKDTACVAADSKRSEEFCGGNAIISNGKARHCNAKEMRSKELHWLRYAREQKRSE